MKEVIYNVAMYLRLSRDDQDVRDDSIDSGGNIKSESNSISSQREIIRAFIREHEDMKLYDIYVDDGFTGSNFDRPEFKRMIEDIEAGSVNCVVVKDLSRFGRDYIESGRYLQKQFPQMGIRFIAITDNYDSMTADRSESAIVVPVKNFINDSYCRDISCKVRSQKKMKSQKGDYIGAFALYGYQKDEKNRCKYIIDDYAAHVVRNIFEWRINGISANAIAVKLNETGILCPSEYKRLNGDNFKSGFSINRIGKWQTGAVLRILTNEVYLGHMIQGKNERVNYKVKKLIHKEQNEWIRVENTHEPIIDEDDFRAVQNLLKTDSRLSPTSAESNFFSGILFCANCGEQMIRRANRYKSKVSITYICSTYNRGDGCTRNNLGDTLLRELVFAECFKYANMFLEQSYLLNEIKQKEANFEIISKYDGEITRLRGERDKFYALSSGLYDDLKNDVLTKKEFEKLHSTYTANVKQLDKAIQSQELLIRKLLKEGIAAGNRLEKFKGCLEINEIDRRTLVNLVHRILYHGDKRVEIVFNFYSEYETAVDVNSGRKQQEPDVVSMERRVKYA